MPPRELRLTKYVSMWFPVLHYLEASKFTLFATRLDDEIYEHTMATFPEFAEPPHDKLVKLDEDWIKSVEGKEKWRKFIAT